MLLKGPLAVGDALWLTKPIGTGVLTTAHKLGECSPEDLASAVASMCVPSIVSAIGLLLR